MDIPSNDDINAQAIHLGLADDHGVCLPRHRARVAKTLIAEANTDEDIDVEDLHTTIARFDSNLRKEGVATIVRAAAVGALVNNLTSTSQIDTGAQ